MENSGGERKSGGKLLGELAVSGCTPFDARRLATAVRSIVRTAMSIPLRGYIAKQYVVFISALLLKFSVAPTIHRAHFLANTKTGNSKMIFRFPFTAVSSL